MTLKLDLYDYNQVEKTCKLAAQKMGLSADAIEGDLQDLSYLLENFVIKHEKKTYPKKSKNKQHQQKTTTTTTTNSAKSSSNLFKTRYPPTI